MKIAFFGTAEFASIILRRLYQSDDINIEMVVSRPAAASGRNNELVNSPVVTECLKLGLPEQNILTPFTLKGSDLRLIEQAMQSVKPDFIITAAYGLIIPESLLGITNYCAINVHASLLPRWRGAAPIERAILAGDEATGVCIMQMTAGLDEGPVAASAKTTIGNKSTVELTQELAELGAGLLIETLPRVENGDAEWTVQDAERATYANKIEKGELNISSNQSALDNVRHVQASSDSHSAKMNLNNSELRIITARSISDSTSNEPAVVLWNGSDLIASCADGSQFSIIELQKPGKQVATALDFVNGVPNLRSQLALPW